MKLTKSKLREIIREEIQRLEEASYDNILKKLLKNPYSVEAGIAAEGDSKKYVTFKYKTTSDRNQGARKLKSKGIKVKDMVYTKEGKQYVHPWAITVWYDKFR